jgi:hypothetical protein
MMKKMIRISGLTMLMIISFNCVAKSADWKFMGGAILKGEEAICYYDNESIEYLQNGNVKVWTKAIKSSEVDKMLKNEQIINNSARKLADGYFPPYISIKIKDTAFDDYVNIISWEEVANNPATKTYLRTLF